MILLLAGTQEARNLAGYLHESDIAVTASLAGVTRTPISYPVPTRIGPFGADQGFERYLDQENITAVIDATHPFASAITSRTARICAEKKLPYLRFERPVWRSRMGDAWHEVKDYSDLEALISAKSRVFIATGRQTLKDFENLKDRALFWRVLDDPKTPFPFDNGEYIVGRAPFNEADEIALFKRLKIDWLVVKNAGGAGARAKLDAARALGISVAMIARPKMPPNIERREQILDALEWALDHQGRVLAKD